MSLCRVSACCAPSGLGGAVWIEASEQTARVSVSAVVCERCSAGSGSGVHVQLCGALASLSVSAVRVSGGRGGRESAMGVEAASVEVLMAHEEAWRDAMSVCNASAEREYMCRVKEGESVILNRSLMHIAFCPQGGSVSVRKEEEEGHSTERCRCVDAPCRTSGDGRRSIEASGGRIEMIELKEGRQETERETVLVRGRVSRRGKGRDGASSECTRKLFSCVLEATEEKEGE